MLASLLKLELICKKNPTSILFARLADTFLLDGDLKRASEVCRRGLRYRPSYVAGHLVMGKCYLAGGKLEEARQEFQKVLQLDADNVSAFWHLGTIELEMGLEESALRHFTTASVLDPFNEELSAQLNELKRPISSSDDNLELNPFDIPTPPSALTGEYGTISPEVEEEQADSEGIGAQVAHLVHDIGSPQQSHEKLGPLKVENQASEGIATKTLAELYVLQGLVEQGVEILEKVREREPENAAVKMRIEELRSATENSN